MRIEVTAHQGKAIEPFGADFDASGGTIGRDQGNTLVLPDMERRISRMHAQVVFRGGQYTLIDHGTATPVFVNEKPLGKGNEARLRKDDSVRIAGYVMRVSIAPSASSAAGTRQDATTVSDSGSVLTVAQKASTRVAGSQSANSGPGLASIRADPFENLLGPATGSADPILSALSESASLIPDDEPAQKSTSVSAAPSVPLPIPEDIFGTASDDQSNTAVEQPLAATPMRISRAESQGSAIDRMIGEAKSEGPDPFSRESTAKAVGSVAQTPDASVDPMVLFGLTSAPGAVPSAPSANHVPEIQSPFRAPSPLVDTPVNSPSVVQSTEIVSDTAPPIEHSAELLHAFLQGAQIQSEVAPSVLNTELMHRIGELLREATQGTLELLVARAETKRELRGDLTMIQGRDNNPLKFSPNVDEALGHLLFPRGDAYLPPSQSMRDAYNDLRSHQMGMMAGIDAAIAGILARFDPNELENRFAERSVFESLLPMARRARLWEMFGELYSDIAKDAEDDYRSIFTKEFLRAYAKQVVELERQQRAKSKS